MSVGYVGGILTLSFVFTLVHAYHYQPAALGWLLAGLQDFFDRMLLSIILTLLAFMQLFVASNVISDERAEAISTIIDLGVTAIGPYDLIGPLILIWMFAPIANRIFRYTYRIRKYSDERLEQCWSDHA